MTCPVQKLEHYLVITELISVRRIPIWQILNAKGGQRLRSSGKISYTLVRESVKKALNSIGLEDDKYYRVHSVRSGGATAAANAGMEE